MTSTDMIQEAQPTLRRQQSGDMRAASLGRIERHVFAALVAGRSMESIAQELGMSDLLAECYRAQVMRKLDVHSIIDLLMIGELADSTLDYAA